MKSMISTGAVKPLRSPFLPGLTGLLLIMLWSVSGPTQAVLGYLTTQNGEFVRNNYGECWHTSRWTPELAVPECEGVQVVTLTLEADTFFDFDRSVLKVEGQRRLDALIADLGGAERIVKVLIVGHTDRLGSAAYNDALSMRRAVAVRDYLSQFGGVPAEAITVEALGERQPVVACEGIHGQALIRCLAPNRRVEITVDLQRAP